MSLREVLEVVSAPESELVSASGPLGPTHTLPPAPEAGCAAPDPLAVEARGCRDYATGLPVATGALVSTNGDPDDAVPAVGL